MPHHTGNLDLMHRVDHAGRGTGAAQTVTNIDDVGDAGALAAKLPRHHDAQQPLFLGGCKRCSGKLRVAIDRSGIGRGYFGHRRHPLLQPRGRRIEFLAHR